MHEIALTHFSVPQAEPSAEETGVVPGLTRARRLGGPIAAHVVANRSLPRKTRDHCQESEHLRGGVVAVIAIGARATTRVIGYSGAVATTSPGERE